MRKRINNSVKWHDSVKGVDIFMESGISGYKELLGI